jgi:dipeptidyl aminopeptidase/acylaminoacyl peptidase
MRRAAAAVALAVLLGFAGGTRASFPAPAGRILAVVESVDGVHLSLLNTNGTVASGGPSVGIRSEGSVAPGGTRLAFTQTVSLPFPGFGRDSELITVDFLGGFAQVTDNQANEGRPSWAPDAKRIAFASDRNGNSDVYVAELPSTATAANLTQSSPAVDRNPRWSPNGESIAFESNRDGNFEIYVMHSDGSEPVNVSRSPADERLGDWSPNSTQLVFTSNRNGDANIYVLDLAFGTVRQITSDPGADTRPAWSPDGMRIAFSSDRDGDNDIFLVNPDGTNETRVTSNASEDLVQDWQPLRDVRPPVVKALPSSSKRGDPIVLRYRITENSRRAAVVYFLDLGAAAPLAIVAGESSLTRIAPGRIYRLTIPILLAVRLPDRIPFCIQAADPSANASRESCARFRFRS